MGTMLAVHCSIEQLPNLYCFCSHQIAAELGNGTSQLRVNINLLTFFCKSISQPRSPHHSNWLGPEGDKLHNTPIESGCNLLGVWCHSAWVFLALGHTLLVVPETALSDQSLAGVKCQSENTAGLYLQSALMQKNIVLTHYSQSC